SIRKVLKTLRVFYTLFLAFWKTLLTIPSTGNLIHPCLVSSSLKISIKKNINHFFCQFKRNEPGRNSQDIGVIMLPAKYRQLFVPTDGGADSLMLICGNGHTVATATNNNALFHLARFYRFTKRVNIIWIIH